jgi:hypothetical protein
MTTNRPMQFMLRSPVHAFLVWFFERSFPAHRPSSPVFRRSAWLRSKKKAFGFGANLFRRQPAPTKVTSVKLVEIRD